jgi:hypothetical protein
MAGWPILIFLQMFSLAKSTLTTGPPIKARLKRRKVTCTMAPPTGYCFQPSRIIGKYPQYLKRFRGGDISAVQLLEHSDSDAILEACAAIPGLDEVIIHHARNLTNKSIASLNKFTGLKKFDGSHGALDGIALARATCWDKLEEFRCSHARNITPMLLKLKGQQKFALSRCA